MRQRHTGRRLATSSPEWAYEYVTIERLLRESDEWLNTHYIGFSPRASIFYEADQTLFILARSNNRGFLCHPASVHDTLAFSPSNWMLAVLVVQLLVEIHGFTRRAPAAQAD